MNQTQSDTPRTDAVESCVKQYAVPQLELILHARKLERELQQVTAELQAAKDWIHADSVRIGELRTGLTTLRARVAELEKELTGERNMHGQTRLVVDELNIICNDLRNAGQPQLIRSEAIRLLREEVCALKCSADQAERLNAELVAALEKISEIENRAWGLDWEEISEARVIAKQALAALRAKLEGSK